MEIYYRDSPNTQRGRTDPVFSLPRRPVRAGQPALLDWTGAGILGVAAQRWPFTQLPFSSARVKRSAGAGERRERGEDTGGRKTREKEAQRDRKQGRYGVGMRGSPAAV